MYEWLTDFNIEDTPVSELKQLRAIAQALSDQEVAQPAIPIAELINVRIEGKGTP